MIFKPYKSGDKITAVMLNELRAAVRAVTPVSGPRVRLTWTPAGVIISAEPGGELFSHPFRVALLQAGKATISPGLLNGIEPVIKGIPLSGDGTKKPTLDWKQPKLGKDRTGYIALECELDKEWKVQPKKVQVVQVAYFDSENGETPPPNSGGPSSAGGIPGLKGRRFRYPLARLIERRDGRLEVLQIAYWNLQHRADVRSRESDIGRHFLWPA